MVPRGRHGVNTRVETDMHGNDVMRGTSFGEVPGPFSRWFLSLLLSLFTLKVINERETPSNSQIEKKDLYTYV